MRAGGVAVPAAGTLIRGPGAATVGAENAGVACTDVGGTDVAACCENGAAVRAEGCDAGAVVSGRSDGPDGEAEPPAGGSARSGRSAFTGSARPSSPSTSRVNSTSIACLSAPYP